MRDFRYGTLVLIPPAELRKTVDQLRAKYDPISAATSMAHITITQPFAKEPTADDLALVESTIKRRQSLDITIGPVTTSPNKRLL